MVLTNEIDGINVKRQNIYMCARNMGSEPDGMTPEAMKEVQDVFNLPKTRPC